MRHLVIYDEPKIGRSWKEIDLELAGKPTADPASWGLPETASILAVIHNVSPVYGFSIVQPLGTTTITRSTSE